jgi:hypothetical protein
MESCANGLAPCNDRLSSAYNGVAKSYKETGGYGRIHRTRSIATYQIRH